MSHLKEVDVLHAHPSFLERHLCGWNRSCQHEDWVRAGQTQGADLSQRHLERDGVRWVVGLNE
jgi:hypothetical protein